MNLSKKKNQVRFPRIACAVAIFAVLGSLFLALQKAQCDTEKQLEQARLELVARVVSQQLVRIVESHVHSLSILADHYAANPQALSREEFVALSNEVSSVSRNFIAINRVDPQGTIVVATPQVTNEAALDRNLLKRDDVRPYLMGSAEAREAQLSNAVDLYQGGLGIVSYVPMFGQGGEFLGWVNGVFRVQSLMGDFITSNNFEDVYLQIRFLNQVEPFYAFGEQSLKDEKSHEGTHIFKIMNQDLELSIHMERGSLGAFGDQVDLAVTVGSIVLSLVLAVLFFYLLESQARLSKRLQKERFDNVMMNILTHDLANHAFAIKAAAYMAIRKVPEEHKAVVERILSTSEAQSELLMRVRDMRAIEVGKKKLLIEQVSLEDLCQKAEQFFGEQFKGKSLSLVCQASEGAETVSVDRLIFQNNVINNLISNALKFSDSNKVIRISSWREDDAVVLEVADDGVGMTSEQLDGLFLENLKTTTEGTFGEIGTGLGMLQVKAYMDFVGGKVVVCSRSKDQHPERHGTEVRLYLPLDGIVHA